MKKLQGKLNNKGSSLVAVIIVMGFISILGALMLTLSAMGYQMKMVEAGAKENQYKVESVLNQLCSGLQEIAENKMEEAYTYTLTRYSATPEEKRTEFTKEKYVEFMENFFRGKVGAAESAAYSISTDGTVKTLQLTAQQRKELVSWLESIKATDDAGFVVNKPESETDSTGKEANTNIVFKTGAGETADDYSVTLTNITVGYKSKGYNTQVTTDIKLAAPAVGFGESTGVASASNLATYGIIADKVVKTPAKPHIYGNLYAGEKLYAESGTMNINGEKVLSRGTIQADGDGKINIKSNVSGNVCQVWADNIKTEKSLAGGSAGSAETPQIHIEGNCNIANDLTMNNPMGTVKLVGEYYGYGLIEGMKSVTYGSSIAVNAPQAKLDLSGLEKLHLAGRASISVDSTDDGGTVSSVTPVMQGESIGYMWSQNAYLLPGDCLPGIGHNPMTLDEYNTTFKDLTGSDKFNITRYVPMALRKYLNPINPYTEIFVKESIGSSGNAIMVYLYMNFMTPNYASTYFQEYAASTFQKNDMEAIATVLNFQSNFFNKTITATDGSDEKIQVAGNVINYKPGNMTGDGYVDTLGEMSVSAGALHTSNVFSNIAINKTYSRNGLVSYLDENRRIANPTVTLLNNLVNINMLESEPMESKNFIAKKGDVQIDAPFEGVIVADGDVTVNAQVKGLVMATGDITVYNTTITADPNVFSTLIKAGVDVQKYFKVDLGGEAQGKGSTTPINKEDFDRVIISFENWRKA